MARRTTQAKPVVLEMPFDWTQLISPAITAGSAWALAYFTARFQAGKTVKEIQQKQQVDFKGHKEMEAYKFIMLRIDSLTESLAQLQQFREVYDSTTVKDALHREMFPPSEFYDALRRFAKLDSELELYYPLHVDRLSAEVVEYFKVAALATIAVGMQQKIAPNNELLIEKHASKLSEENLQECMKVTSLFKGALSRYINGEEKKNFL